MNKKTLHMYVIAFASVITVTLFQNCSSETPFELKQLQNQKLEGTNNIVPAEPTEVTILSPDEVSAATTETENGMPAATPTINNTSNTQTQTQSDTNTDTDSDRTMPGTTTNTMTNLSTETQETATETPTDTSTVKRTIASTEEMPNTDNIPTSQPPQLCVLNVERVLLAGNGNQNFSIAEIKDNLVEVKTDAQGKNYAEIELDVKSAPKQSNTLHIQLRDQNGQINIKLDSTLEVGINKVRIDDIRLLKSCGLININLKGKKCDKHSDDGSDDLVNNQGL